MFWQTRFDYGNHHRSLEERNAHKIRQNIINHIPSMGANFVSQESEGEHSIIVDLPEPWIFVGDSTSRTEDGNPVAFNKLAIELSTIAPTINVLVSNSAITHLYVDGKLVDKFGNETFLCTKFRSSKESQPFQGNNR